MNKKFLNVNLYVWLSFVILSLLFILFPQIDLYVSSLFFDGTFYLRNTLYETFFYKSVPIVLTLFVLSTLLIFIYNKIKHTNYLSLDNKAALFLLLTLLIAPGLLVNTLLKENWQRARPAQIVQFGGEKTFTPPFVISDQDGYSFSSGHGAAAFSMLAFALLAKRRRKFWISLALAYGVAVSFARIIAGGHFLSDNVTSFFIVYITAYALYGYIVEEKDD